MTVDGVVLSSEIFLSEVSIAPVAFMISFNQKHLLGVFDLRVPDGQESPRG